jgi:hypothetical protein
MRGNTLVELLVALTLGALVMLGLARAVRGGIVSEAERGEQATLATDVQFALERMTAAVRGTELLIVPFADDPRTGADEAVREQSVPTVGALTAVLAVALPPTLDRNGDGTADADNDGDGRIDEDHGGDSTSDGATGIAGIDDDNDGVVDEMLVAVGDDDEDGGLTADDPVNGVDDDGDGNVDEDGPADMNADGRAGISGVDDDGDGTTDEGQAGDDDEDGSVSEDGIEPVVFYLRGSTLIERVPVPWDASGNGAIDAGDYVEQPIAERVTYFRLERIAGGRATLVDITLELATARGERLRLTTRQRVGGGV